MRELNRSRKFENNSDVRYYDGYTKFTVPRVRGNQYNPMIVGEREELFNNILDSIDKKQTSPKYDDLFYVEGKNIDASGGVEYRGMLSHSDDDYTKVNILCELRDKKSGKTFESFEKDLVIDYSDFMDSYGIESDIEDYILDELNKYMISILTQYDNKYKNENKTMRELKRNRMNESEKLVGDAKLLRSLSEKMDNVRNLLNDDVSKVIIQSLADSVRALSTMNIKGVDSSRYASAEYIFKKDLEISLDSLKKHYQK